MITQTALAMSVFALMTCPAAAENPPELPNHFASFRPLVGGVWEAEAVNSDGEAYTWELRFTPILRNRFIRIESRNRKDGRVTEESVLIVGWDAEAGKVKRWGFDTDGGVTETVITPVADGRRYDYRNPDGTRATATYRSNFPDEDTWELIATGRSHAGESLPDETWKFRRRRGDEPDGSV